jgi:hypothetical protein
VTSTRRRIVNTTRRRSHPRIRSADTELTLLPAATASLTREQHRRAVAALAELLHWVMEEQQEDERYAA